MDLHRIACKVYGVLGAALGGLGLLLGGATSLYRYSHSDLGGWIQTGADLPILAPAFTVCAASAVIFLAIQIFRERSAAVIGFMATLVAVDVLSYIFAGLNLEGKSSPLQLMDVIVYLVFGSLTALVLFTRSQRQSSALPA